MIFLGLLVFGCFTVEDLDEGGVRTIFSLPPLSLLPCAFVLPSETSSIIAHILPNMCDGPPWLSTSAKLPAFHYNCLIVALQLPSFMWQQCG